LQENEKRYDGREMKDHGFNHATFHPCKIGERRLDSKAGVLKLVAEGQVIVIGRCRRWFGRCGSSGDVGCRRAACWGRWYLNLARHAQNLANIDIGAILVDLGVVQVKDGVVDAMVGSNLVARIVENNYVSR